MENNNNYFNFNDENTFILIMTFIKQIVGDDAIKEILWDESIKDIDIEELIHSTNLNMPYDETPLIIDIFCKIDLREAIRFMKTCIGKTSYIAGWDALVKRQRDKKIVELYRDNMGTRKIARMYGLSVRRVYQIIERENKLS